MYKTTQKITGGISLLLKLLIVFLFIFQIGRAHV